MRFRRAHSPPARSAILALAFTLAVVAAGCGGDDEGGTGQGEEDGVIQVSGEEANDHGSEDVSGAESSELELDDFYFEPTVIVGDPGQTITLEAFNEGDTEHNFSLEDEGIDVDLDTDDRREIEVTFPNSGTLLFFCKYHAGQGMRGGLDAG